MKSVAARGRASSNRDSYGGAGLLSEWAGPPSSDRWEGERAGVGQREKEEAGGGRPEEEPSRLGVEVRRCREEEEEEEE